MSYWRDTARAVIVAALADGKALGLDGPALVRLVDERYPFGPRENHPYKIWLSERRARLRGVLPAKSAAKEPHPLFDREAAP